MFVVDSFIDCRLVPLSRNASEAFEIKDVKEGS
jgi:hypothetical protein